MDSVFQVVPAYGMRSQNARPIFKTLEEAMAYGERELETRKSVYVHIYEYYFGEESYANSWGRTINDNEWRKAQ
jgi:hypothetical protein